MNADDAVLDGELSDDVVVDEETEGGDNFKIGAVAG
jgi:hypothetical protein